MNPQQSTIPRSYDYFSALVKMHFTCLLADLLITTFAERGKHNIYILIGFYSLQLILITANLLMLFIEFTNTQPFRAGLLRLLVNCGCYSCGFTVGNPLYWLFGFKRQPQLEQQQQIFKGSNRELKASGKANTGPSANRGEFNAAVWWTVIYFLLATATRVYGAILMWNCSDNGGAAVVCDPWSNLAYRLIYLVFRTGGIGYYYYFRRAILGICDPKYYRIDSQWLQERLGALRY